MVAIFERARTSAVWQFFRVLVRADRVLAIMWWTFVVLRSALPAAFVLAMGATVTAVQHHHSLLWPLTEIGISFIAMQAVGPVHDALSSNLGAKVSVHLHDRLMHACARPPGLGHLEHPALADDLSAARDLDLGLTCPSIIVSMPHIGSGFALFGGGVAQALLLFGGGVAQALLLFGGGVAQALLLFGYRC